VGDSVRQQFTAKERDAETGLDYFLARYYTSMQGRFTSTDEFAGGPLELFDFSATASENPTFYSDRTQPQSLNKYQYCLNNPLLYVDPDGHQQAVTQRIMLERGNLSYISQSLGEAYERGKNAVIDAKNEVVGFRQKVHKALGVDRDSLIESGIKGGLPREWAERAADHAIAINDGIMIGPSKGVTTAEDAGVMVNKAVNSELVHAAERAVERNFYGTVKEAADALRSLSKEITKNGLPKGTIMDRAHSDRVLVPLKEGAYAAYQVLKYGTARL
jgi:RHS repeat-associated protein